MNYVVYDKNGKILRTIICPPSHALSQAKEGEFVMEGNANDVTQKIVAGKIVNKTPAEIVADNPPPPIITFEKQTAHINNEQWQDVLSRITTLEDK